MWLKPKEKSTYTVHHLREGDPAFGRYDACNVRGHVLIVP